MIQAEVDERGGSTPFVKGEVVTVTLTDGQEKQIQNVRQAIGKLTREFRGKLFEILTDEQKAKLKFPPKGTAS